MNNSITQVNRCLNSPILIHESTSQELPCNLRLLLESLDQEKLTESDYLVILAYTLMVETGFIPYHEIDKFKGAEKSSTFDIRYLMAAQTLPNDWKDADGTYKLDFALPSLPDSKVSLKALNGGFAIIVTVWLTFKEEKPSWCLALEFGKYILSTPTEFMSHVFFNLKNLSNKFKNAISLPIRSYLKNTVTVEMCDLLSLPLEMIMLISKYLMRRDVKHLSQTCKVMYTLLG